MCEPRSQTLTNVVFTMYRYVLTSVPNIYPRIIACAECMYKPVCTLHRWMSERREKPHSKYVPHIVIIYIGLYLCTASSNYGKRPRPPSQLLLLL